MQSRSRRTTRIHNGVCPYIRCYIYTSYMSLERTGGCKRDLTLERLSLKAQNPLFLCLRLLWPVANINLCDISILLWYRGTCAPPTHLRTGRCRVLIVYTTTGGVQCVFLSTRADALLFPTTSLSLCAVHFLSLHIFTGHFRVQCIFCSVIEYSTSRTLRRIRR